MKFSIVMPVLNGKDFLAAAIESIVNQSHTDWELIIIDGGSTDGARDIAASFADGDPRIFLVGEPDEGIYDAIFKGFSRARGDWLSWLNSDDLYTPWCFATVVEHVERYGGDWVTGYPASWDREGRLRYARPAGLYPKKLVEAGWFHGGLLGCIQQESVFFSRTLLEKLTGEEIDSLRNMRLAGDFQLWRYFARHAALETLPSVIGGFRRHGGNLSLTSGDGYQEEVLATGAFAPPKPIAATLALFFRAASAWAMLKAAARADEALTTNASQHPAP